MQVHIAAVSGKAAFGTESSTLEMAISHVGAGKPPLCIF